MVVTSHDVARLAGVSQPTVSRALRDSPKVSADTKQRVRRAADVLGYVPSETGRALSSGRTRRVGLLVTDLDNQFYAHVISPMHHELESLGYQLVLQTESSDSGRVAERLIANSLDGVLLATTTSTSASSAATAVVSAAITRSPWTRVLCSAERCRCVARTISGPPSNVRRAVSAAWRPASVGRSSAMAVSTVAGGPQAREMGSS